MNISRLRKFAWVFFALALATATVFAQNGKNGNFSRFNQNQDCFSQISDLTEGQKTKIRGMNNTHQDEMALLRTERRSTSDATEKNEIRETMLKKVEAHREEVRNVLTESQQKEFVSSGIQGNNHKNQSTRRGSGGQKGRNCSARGNSGKF